MTQMVYSVTNLPEQDLARIASFLEKNEVKHRINEFNQSKELVILDDEMSGILRSFERMLGIRDNF